MDERKVWASTHGIVACLPHMAHGDVYAPSLVVLGRWLTHGQPVYVVDEPPAWMPEWVAVVHAG